jgi:site-specific DNA-methyltransferase (adenine-specific)
MQIVEININDIKPYAKNAKKHPTEQIGRIANSLREFGFRQPLVIDKNNVLVIGHGRLAAAKRLGYDTVPCLYADDLTDDQIKALRLADNKTNESDWDFDFLNIELDDITDIDMSQFGFDLGDDDVEPPEIIEDEAPDDVETRAKLGDVWQLGDHRLICGDCTDIAVIDTLMGGVKADMVFTDPPYNIASDSKNFASDVSKAMKDLSESEWDKNFDIREVLDNILVSIAENATVYVCTSHFLASDIWAWMKEWADHYSYCVWSKPNPMPSLAKRHWTWNTELICYATRGKHTFNFPKEGHALSTWTINKKNGDTGHPTEKPVEVPAMAVSHSSKENDVVLDLFGGSGSTLIACEQLNRKCFMCELDPHYCDVILTRWEKFTGKEAVLLNGDGR